MNAGCFPVSAQKRCTAQLLNGLAGRTWTGKEALLAALADVCLHGSVPNMIADNEGTEGSSNIQITESALAAALLKECQKDKVTYKIEALNAAGVIFEAVGIDRFEELYQAFSPLIKVKGAYIHAPKESIDETLPIGVVAQCTIAQGESGKFQNKIHSL